MRRRLLDQSSHDFVAGRSAKKRHFWIMQHFAREKMSILHGNVRKIRHDQVESFIQILEKIILLKLDPLFQPESLRILTRERERIVGNVDRENLCFRKLL